MRSGNAITLKPLQKKFFTPYENEKQLETSFNKKY